MKRRMREKLLAREARIKAEEDFEKKLYEAAINYLSNTVDYTSTKGIGKSLTDTDVDKEVAEELEAERKRIQKWVDEQHELRKEDNGKKV